MKKKTILTSVLAFTCWMLAAQNNFVITAADMPAPEKDQEVRVYANNAKIRSVATGNFGQKDFSLLGEGTPTPMNYFTTGESLFTEAGMELARTTEKKFVPGFVYKYSAVLDFKEQGIEEAGIMVPAQSYPLTPFTGKATDHLDIPEQQYILDEPKTLIEFPMEEGSAWQSESRRVVDFTLTVGAYGLSAVPAQHVWTVYREEKITGYGKIRVYHPDGPSEYYEVLKSEITEYAIDSFYLNGQAAPDALLKAFGARQGQKITIDNRVNFYRKGSFTYLLSLYFGNIPFQGEAVNIIADMEVERPAEKDDEKEDEDKEDNTDAIPVASRMSIRPRGSLQ
ncbi:MAG: hypothetical protein NTW29_22360 [Bacteroidetes bacterium]|nr:hypothetical protein [Bacteroidota bacterium]